MPCVCVWTVDSETWLRNDPLVPYSCNLFRVQMCYSLLLEVYLKKTTMN